MNTDDRALADLIAPCGHCHGVGDIGDGDHSCMICGGSGTVTVKASRDTIGKFLSEIMARSPNGEPVKVQYHPNGDWTVFDRLEAFHAKNVVGERYSALGDRVVDVDDHNTFRVVPVNRIDGDALAIGVAEAMNAALQSPPPVVSGEAQRTQLCYLIERMCPDKPESNLGNPVGSQVEALADAILALTPVEGVGMQGPVLFAVERWEQEVKNRPLNNVHRRSLDDAWRQVIRYYGGDDVALIGPCHDDLAALATLGAPHEG